ncbi:hypothetical protein ACT691_00660 [Vibrio metschnikovii]
MKVGGKPSRRNKSEKLTAQSLVATTAQLYWQIGYLKQRIRLSQQDD